MPITDDSASSPAAPSTELITAASATEADPAPPEASFDSSPQEVGASAEAELQDREIACRECGTSFTFTSGEQAFYRDRGFTNEPTRCPNCRSSRRSGRRTQRGEDEGSRVVCAACGVITTVPFRPSGNKPVYCRDCYTVRD